MRTLKPTTPMIEYLPFAVRTLPLEWSGVGAADGEHMSDDTSQLVRELNDRFRRSVLDARAETEPPGQGVMTQGVSAIPSVDRLGAIEAVRTFEDFTGDNDPYEEHDFGSFEQGGEKLFWKIDVYADATCRAGSEAPHDLAQSYRVLTIMLASEY